MSGRALAGRVPDVEAEKGRVSAAPVQRYWPGKAPEWYKPDEAAEDDEVVGEPGTSAPALPVVLERADDPRLRRLAQACSATVQIGYAVPYTKVSLLAVLTAGLHECCSLLAGMARSCALLRRCLVSIGTP